METFESSKNLAQEVITPMIKELNEQKDTINDTICAKQTITKIIAKINKIPEKPITITYPETIKNPDKFPGSINI